MKYLLDCKEEHEPETLSVMADSDDEALEKMVAEVKKHEAEKHPQMSMSEKEMEEYIKSNWRKESPDEDEGSAAMQM